jgi:hypothetical protein
MGKYDKLHLFDVVCILICIVSLFSPSPQDLKNSGGTTVLESKTTLPGTRLLPPVSTPVGKGLKLRYIRSGITL